MTHVTRHMPHSVGWTFSQNLSSLALAVWDWQCLEDIWTKASLNESVNELMNDRDDYRTAPGLLIISHQLYKPYWEGYQLLAVIYYNRNNHCKTKTFWHQIYCTCVSSMHSRVCQEYKQKSFKKPYKNFLMIFYVYFCT